MEGSSKIHRITLDVTYTNPPVANHALTGRIRDLFNNELEPAIDDAFLHAPAGERVLIEKCVIDLGVVNEKDFSSLLSLRLQEELEVIRHSTSPEVLLSATDSKAYTQEEIIIYFLETGMLLWYALLNTDIDELFKHELAERNSSFTKNLISLFNSNEAARYRFVVQLERDNIITFIEKAIELLPVSIRAILTTWLLLCKEEKLIIAKAEEAFFQICTFLTATISQTILKDKSALIKDFIQIAISPIIFINEEQEETIHYTLLSNNSHDIAIIKKLMADFIQQLNNSNTSNNTEQKTGIKDLTSSTKQPVDNASSIAIEQAGTVLLAPFFATLFTRLQLLQEGNFISEKHRSKATQVLHYIATGQTKTPEHLLSIHKIICGLPLHYPVSKTLKLTDDEKEICNDLLLAVIEHWSALKNTSPAGLRETFIQRRGTMTQDSNEWIVTVERKGFDILLEQIPWQFKVLSFSWNTYIIHVNW